jgi:uncharacterized protein (DUF58 family)
VDVPPASIVSAFYTLKPLHKGPCSFPSIYIRIKGPLGFFARQARIRQATTADVTPNLIEVKKYLNLLSLNRLSQLGYRKRGPGGESEFDFLRDYVPGDDYRRINWKATAKRGRPVTQVCETEFNRNIIVLLDAGRMMTTRYGLVTQLDLAADSTLILAAAAGRKKDYFRLLAFADRTIAFLPPSGNTMKVQAGVLATLRGLEPRFTRTEYKSVYAQLTSRIRKNSLIFLFSEFHDRLVSRDLMVLLELLAQRHNVHFINFEKREERPDERSVYAAARWAIEQDQIIEREIAVKQMEKCGVRIIHVNADNIRQKVVNTYLAS